MAKLAEFFSINLGHNSIKLIEVKLMGNKARIINNFKMPTNEGLVENDSEEGVKNLSSEIAKAAKVGNFSTKNCVISVPEVSVFSRLITLPELKEEEISDAINYAVKPLLPIPLENVNISFLEINKQVIDNKPIVNWYVVAAPKQLISKLQIAVENAGLNLLAVETEALAIARMIQYNYALPVNTDCMVLDLGADSTNLILTRNGVVIFSQNIGTGSQALTKVIAADFGLEPELAERYKLTYGLNPNEGEGKIFKSIEPIIQIMISEIQRTLVYYKDKIGGTGITKIYLTGGGAHLIWLDQYINEKLAIASEVVNPLRSMQVEEALLKNLSNGGINSLNVAIGLALKGIL